MATVKIEQLVKVYAERGGPGTQVVHGIDLEVRDGEFMVFVGPSGCGKSTTLRMIAGLEDISGGTISIDGRVVNDVLPKDRDIAMVFQNYALYPHMTVYDNMAFGLKMRKLPKSEIDRRVREASAMLGLDKYLQRKPKALSGGQRQRVAVGRAIVRKPKVFLFDEPLSNLDAKMRAGTRTEITRLHRRLGATMIYVTHDQVEAMTMGDRICVMKEGRIMQLATPLELYERPQNLFVAGFLGNPPMNFIKGKLHGAGDRFEFVELGTNPSSGRLSVDVALPQLASAQRDQVVVMGFRPERATIGEPAPGEKTISIPATLNLVEQMGSESYWHLETPNHPLVIRVDSGRHASVGERLTVQVPVDALHFFDSATEQSLTSRL